MILIVLDYFVIMSHLQSICSTEPLVITAKVTYLKETNFHVP